MIELGLQRISRLLSHTPLPWRAIHVAGTNGKGSICAYISRMLDVYNASPWRQYNHHPVLKHGRFTSPHLIDRWDCITLNQEPVSPKVFREMEDAVLARNRREGIEASEFELLTATAFEIFGREGVDVGVVEVGMGGRLDATNVIGQHEGLEVPQGIEQGTFRPPPLVTAISSIGLDHQAFLGNTLEDIAREKAGIIKPRVPVVTAPNEPAINQVLTTIATDRGSPLYTTTSSPDHCPDPKTFLGLLHYLETSHTPHLLSSHTLSNARTAFLSTFLALQQLGHLPIDIASILKPTLGEPTPPVLEMWQTPLHTTFPGRLQQLNLSHLTGRKEDVLLDGAHNAQSATALAQEIERLGNRKNGGRVTWVLAASDSKDAREILAPLLRNGDVVFTVEFGAVDGMPWVQAQKGKVLEEAARAVVEDGEALKVKGYGRDVSGALKAAADTAGGGPLVVAGSLYLVGDVLRLLRDA